MKRVEEERRKGEEKGCKELQDLEAKFQQSLETMHDMERQHKINEAERAKEEALRMEKLQEKLEARIKEDQQLRNQREKELQLQLRELETQQKKSSSSNSILPIIGILVLLAGAATANPAAITGGLATAGAGTASGSQGGWRWILRTSIVSLSNPTQHPFPS